MVLTVAVMTLEPPAAPVARYNVEFAIYSIIARVIDESGLFPRAIEFAAVGINSKALVVFDTKKSFIPLSMIILVSRIMS